MSKDNEWEDVPQNELPEIKEDDGWEDVPPEGEMSEESIDVDPSLIGAGAGGSLGLAAQKTAEILPGEGLQNLAKKQAFKSIGGGRTPTGRKFLKSTLPQEIRQEIMGGDGTSLFTPKDIGEKVLDEGMFEIEDVLNKQQVEGKELEDLLGSVSKKATPEELQTRYSRMIDKAYPDKETKVGQKASKSVDKFNKRLEEASDKSAKELERMKRQTTESIDYGPGAKKINNELEKLEAKTFRDAAEQLIEDSGSEELLKEFKKAKTKTGQTSVIRKIITEDLVQEYAQANKLDFQDALAIVYNRPDILVARKALKSRGLQRGLAKGLKATGEGIERLKGSKLLKKLPVVGAAIGAGLGYSSARAEGLEPAEALGRTIEEEGIEAIPVVGPALVPESSGPKRGTPEFELEQGKQPTAPIKQTEEAKKQFEKAKYNPIEEREKLENFLKEFQQLRSNPAVERFSQDAETLLTSEDENEKARIRYSLEQQPGYKRLLARAEKKRNME